MTNENKISKLDFLNRLQSLVDKCLFTEIELKKTISKQSKKKNLFFNELREFVRISFIKDVYDPEAKETFAEQFDAFFGSSRGSIATYKIKNRIASKSREIKDRNLEFMATYQDSEFLDRADDMIENYRIEKDSYENLDFEILGDDYKESRLETVINEISLEEYLFLTENYSAIKFTFSKLTKEKRENALVVKSYLASLVTNNYWKENEYTLLTPWDVVDHHSDNHRLTVEITDKINKLLAKKRNFKVAYEALNNDASYVRPSDSEIYKEIREEIEDEIKSLGEATLFSFLGQIINFYRRDETRSPEVNAESSRSIVKKLTFFKLSKVFLEKLDQEMFSVSAKKRKIMTGIHHLKESKSFNATFGADITEKLSSLLDDQHVRAISYISWIDNYKYSIFNLENDFNAFSDKSLIIAIISSLLVDESKPEIEKATARILFSNLIDRDFDMYSDDVKDFMSKSIYELANCEIPDMQNKFMDNINILQDSVIFDIENAVDNLLNDIEVEQAKRNTESELGMDEISYDQPESGFTEVKKE